MYAATASAMTAPISRPRSRPKAPPRTRSTGRSPADFAALRAISPASENNKVVSTKSAQKAPKSAIGCAFTNCRNQGATLGYAQAAITNPKMTPARENASYKKPRSAANKIETATTASSTQSKAVILILTHGLRRGLIVLSPLRGGDDFEAGPALDPC